MAIEFKARVLLELGAELISSDAVAFYELIKNAIDARSPSVTISIHIALQFTEYQELYRQLKATKNNDFDDASFLDRVRAVMETDAQEEVRHKFLKTLGRPRTVAAAMEALEEAYLAGSFIVVADKGHGMNAETLQKGYLTIGTPMRLLSKSRSTEANWNHQSTPGGRALGEKGIGRLAAMRLGHYVHVQTGMEILCSPVHRVVLHLGHRLAEALVGLEVRHQAEGHHGQGLLPQVAEEEPIGPDAVEVLVEFSDVRDAVEFGGIVLVAVDQELDAAHQGGQLRTRGQGVGAEALEECIGGKPPWKVLKTLRGDRPGS